MPENLAKFIQDMIDMPYDRAYLNHLYTEEQVTDWMNDIAVIKAIKAGQDKLKLERAKNKDLFIEDILRCRNKALQNCIVVLNDKNHKDHTKISTLFMSAELAYIEAYFKAKGEQDALSGDDRMGTILQFVNRDKKAD